MAPLRGVAMAPLGGVVVVPVVLVPLGGVVVPVPPGGVVPLGGVGRLQTYWTCPASALSDDSEGPHCPTTPASAQRLSEPNSCTRTVYLFVVAVL